MIRPKVDVPPSAPEPEPPAFVPYVAAFLAILAVLAIVATFTSHVTLLSHLLDGIAESAPQR